MELVIFRCGEGDDDVVPSQLDVAGPELPEAGKPIQGVVLHHQAKGCAHVCCFSQADPVVQRKHPRQNRHEIFR